MLCDTMTKLKVVRHPNLGEVCHETSYTISPICREVYHIFIVTCRKRCFFCSLQLSGFNLNLNHGKEVRYLACGRFHEVGQPADRSCIKDLKRCKLGCSYAKDP